MSSNRDQVRTEPNERIDRPDFDAIQRGDRADVRSDTRHLLFAGNARRTGGGWGVTAAGTPDATVTVASGTAWGAVQLADGTYEYGVAFGLEGDTSQVLDFTGKPNGTYGVWVRPSYTAGTTGNRVFWDANLGEEVVAPIDTRYVAGWDAQAALVTPGSEWQKVASVVWGGATIATGNITGARFMFFEGDEAASFAAVWGDGVNDRNAARGSYGVTSLYTWVHAVRRVIEDIYDNGQKWYEAPSYTLKDAKDHADLTLNPHSSSPTWTGTITVHNPPIFEVGFEKTGYSAFSFSDFMFDPNGGGVPRWGSSAGPGVESVTDPRFINYPGSDSSGQDIVLDVRRCVGQLNSLGYVKIPSIAIYWNQSTIPAETNAGNKIVWRFEHRSGGGGVGGEWTVYANGEFAGGHDYNSLTQDPDVATLTINYDHDYGSSDTYEIRLVLNMQGTFGNIAPVVYGGLIVYEAGRLFPS